MGIMEERLTLTESRVSGMIASQRTAAYQQQRAHIEQSDLAQPAAQVTSAFAASTSTAVPASATATSSSNARAAASPATATATATAIPSTSDLRTIKLRVMCRHRGLDSTGMEAELM